MASSATTQAGVLTTGRDDEEAARRDLEALLDRAPTDVAERLRTVVWDGDLDGGDYEWCLLGWVARLSGTPLCELGAGRPIERYVLEIRRGQVPENDPRVARLYEWLSAYTLQRAAREASGQGGEEAAS